MALQVAEVLERQSIFNVDVELARLGNGKQLLLLHAEDGLEGYSDILEALAKHFQVFSPSHPGYGGSTLPHNFSTVDDLAYFYLDLIEALDLDDAVLMGAGIGAWIAAEVATKSTKPFSHLVLAGALGVKFADREASDFADIFSLPPGEVAKRGYRNPAAVEERKKTDDEDKLRRIARNREATTLFGWSPYMYNPKLRQRLHRIKIPTLMMWGENDEISPPDYGRTYATALPNARFELIADAAHHVFEEQPQRVTEAVVRFIAG